MTFDSMLSSSFTMPLSGAEAVGLYLALSGDEERLDACQRAALERLRSILYEHLSVEELEGIASSYAGAVGGPRP